MLVCCGANDGRGGRLKTVIDINVDKKLVMQMEGTLEQMVCEGVRFFERGNILGKAGTLLRRTGFSELLLCSVCV